MARYTVEDSQTGKRITFEWDGAGQPTDSDMEQVFAEARSMQPTQTPAPIPNTPPDRQTLRDLAAMAAPYARPALEMGGALAGAALSSPGNVVAPGLASLAGAGLGFAGGRQVANALDEFAGSRKTATLPEALASTAMAIPEGAAMEAGGAITNKAIQAGLKMVSKAAPRIYESVAKIAPRSVPKFERDRAVKTALENEIPATQKGMGKLRGKIDDLNDQISRLIEGAKDSGKGTLSVDSIVSRLEDVKTWAMKSFADPTPVLKSIDEYKAGVLNTRGGEISVSAAQKLKQGIYRRLTDSAYGEFSTASKEMDKAFARGIKEELVKQFPQLQKLNSEDSALIGLSNILEKTVNRTRNWDLAGLTDIAGSGVGAVAGGHGGDLKKGGEGAAIGFMVARALRSPAIMSRLAFALNKAGKLGGAPLTSRAVSYGLTGIGRDDRENKAVGAVSPAIGALDPASGASAGQAEASMMPMRSAASIPDASPASSAIRAAMTAYNAGDYDQTISALRQAIKSDPARANDLRFQLLKVMREKEVVQKYKKRG